MVHLRERRSSEVASKKEAFDEDWTVEVFRTSPDGVWAGMLLFNMCCCLMLEPRRKLKDCPATAMGMFALPRDPLHFRGTSNKMK